MSQDPARFLASMQRLTEIKGRFTLKDLCDARKCGRAEALRHLTQAIVDGVVTQPDGVTWYAWKAEEPAFDLDFQPCPERIVDDLELRDVVDEGPGIALLCAVDEVLRLHTVFTRGTPHDLDVALDGLRVARKAVAL